MLLLLIMVNFVGEEGICFVSLPMNPSGKVLKYGGSMYFIITVLFLESDFSRVFGPQEVGLIEPCLSV